MVIMVIFLGGLQPRHVIPFAKVSNCRLQLRSNSGRVGVTRDEAVRENTVERFLECEARRPAVLLEETKK
jgi:hypothetical protein